MSVCESVWPIMICLRDPELQMQLDPFTMLFYLTVTLHVHLCRPLPSIMKGLNNKKCFCNFKSTKLARLVMQGSHGNHCLADTGLIVQLSLFCFYYVSPLMGDHFTWFCNNVVLGIP